MHRLYFHSVVKLLTQCNCEVNLWKEGRKRGKEEGWLGGREGRSEGEGDERMDGRAIERKGGASSKRWTTFCPSSHFSQKPCQTFL